MGKSKSTYFRRPTLTNMVQASKLKRAFPASRFNLQRNFGLTWTGKLHPTPLSVTYTVSISYRLGERPEVTILDPVLTSRNGEGLPHVFPGNHPCLFRFRYREWNGTMPIVNTI